MALEMTATITASNEQGLAEALTDIRRLVKRGCIYDSKKEEGVAYTFRVDGTPTFVLEPDRDLVLDLSKENVT